MSFKLIPLTDAHMTRQQVYLPRPKHFYPSEASVKYIDVNGVERVEGTCLRASWYRLKGGFEREATNPYGEWIFALGKAVEEILVEQWKEMGIWVGNNIKFYDKENDISGEIDCMIRDLETGELVCTEIKSFYGYKATKDICGNKSQEGRPKTSQLLQSLIYVDLGRRTGQFNYVKMIYYARDSANRAEFDIKLIQDNEVWRPTINGVIDYRFTMEDIYSRYQELNIYLNNDKIPPRDYEISWDAEKIEKEFLLGNVAKTTYEDWKKNPKKNTIGDWNCRYCGFCNICYEK